MKCNSCGSVIDPTGVFPGGKIRCACGADNIVAAQTSRQDRGGPYRATAGRSPDEPSDEPAPIPAATPRSHCARCSRPLETVTREGYPIELCAAGHGLFVETAVLACMIEEAKNAAPWDPDLASRPALAGSGPVRYVPCPVCAQTMSRRNFGRISGVLIDECPDHGTWFDAGELEQSMAFASSGRMQQQVQSLPSAEADRILIDARRAESEECRRDREMVQNASSLIEDVLYLLGWPGGRRRW